MELDKTLEALKRLSKKIKKEKTTAEFKFNLFKYFAIYKIKNFLKGR